MKKRNLQELYNLINELAGVNKCELIENLILKEISDDLKNGKLEEGIYEIDEDNYEELQRIIKDLINQNVEQLNQEIDFQSFMESLIDLFWGNSIQKDALLEVIEYALLFLDEIIKKQNLRKNFSLSLRKNSILYLEKKEKRKENRLNERLEILVFFITNKFIFSHFSSPIKNKEALLKNRYKMLLNYGQKLLQKGWTINCIYEEMCHLMQESKSIINVVENFLVECPLPLDPVIKSKKISDFRDLLMELVKELFQKNFQLFTVQVLFESIFLDVFPFLTRDENYQFMEGILAYIDLLFID
jgi:hypothetical protein|uniref:Uncharacterized protein n=1 Tax=Synura petersenii TaxID=52555 RepID=A0A3G2QYI9_9STRA|nr:hypothetical protein [Synura petersenii]AYO28180.1 hypothetical protein [Synura petersenii]